MKAQKHVPHCRDRLLRAVVSTIFLTVVMGVGAAPPFDYVWGTAYHILPETHSEESGYFSLCEGHDGQIYVGTAKYNHNAYLVKFDPRTEQQKIVLDTHKVCGLDATGYAAQAKLHTRNYVGPSGTIYVGSKQGYPAKGDTSTYPGGYLMTYDPRNGSAKNLGMPFKEQGIADVVADEARELIYVVTCEDQHWMRYSIGEKKYKELGPMLTPYATTLVDGEGRAHSITKDFELATYDPKTDKVIVRPIHIGKEKWVRKNKASIPTWNLASDGKTAWLILMNDATLFSIDLASEGKIASGTDHGKMVDGEKPDSRSALTIAPDGRIYTLIRVQNKTGFGKGMLHHLCRFDPTTKKHEDLGVLAVKNPDFFDFKPKDGKKPPWSHGYHTLPDGTMTPLHNHMALIATRDNTLYATIIYPFTLLKIDAFRKPVKEQSRASRYLKTVEGKLDQIEKRMNDFTALGELAAKRYDNGGLIGFHWLGATLEQELIGRSGGLMHIGFDRPWKEKGTRTDEEKKHDIAVVAWDSAARPNDLKRLQQFKDKGQYLIGFGSRAMEGIDACAKLCDEWVEAGASANDDEPGKVTHVISAVAGWVWMAEMTAAFTRKGKMPPMWKSWAMPDGKDWSERYFRKVKYHDEFTVPPIPKGELGRACLDQMRSHIRAFSKTQLPTIQQFADTIAKEQKAGKKTVVASSGHMAMHYIGKFSDKTWATNIEVHANVASQINRFRKNAPDGGLVLRLGYFGLYPEVQELFDEKKSRVLLMTSENPLPEAASHLDYPVWLDLGCAFGDACVPIEGYPIPLFPPSGVMQAVAYECLNVEVQERIN